MLDTRHRSQNQGNHDTGSANPPAHEMARPQKPRYVWKCRCEKVRIDVVGEPLFCFNCHCRSCVAAMRYIEENHPGGTSAASPCGGAAKVQLALTDLRFPDGVDGLSDRFGYVKVGDGGVNVRSYAKCCGTQINTSGGEFFPCHFRPFNRNALYRCREDGSVESYEPPVKPVANMNLQYALCDKSKVPEPKYDGASVPILYKFV